MTYKNDENCAITDIRLGWAAHKRGGGGGGGGVYTPDDLWARVTRFLQWQGWKVCSFLRLTRSKAPEGI